MPTHNLEESPCYPIIHSKSVGNHIWYYCSLHSDFKNISLSSIEHHCRYHEPDRHKVEILKLISRNQELHQEIDLQNNDDPDTILLKDQLSEDLSSPDVANPKVSDRGYV